MIIVSCCISSIMFYRSWCSIDPTYVSGRRRMCSTWASVHHVHGTQSVSRTVHSLSFPPHRRHAAMSYSIHLYSMFILLRYLIILILWQFSAPGSFFGRSVPRFYSCEVLEAATCQSPHLWHLNKTALTWLAHAWHSGTSLFSGLKLYVLDLFSVLDLFRDCGSCSFQSVIK